MSGADGLAAALVSLASGTGSEDDWSLLQSAARRSVLARRGEFGPEFENAIEDCIGEVAGRMADRALRGILPDFEGLDARAAGYFKRVAHNLLVDEARRRERSAPGDVENFADPRVVDDDTFDPDTSMAQGRARFDALVEALATRRRPQDRPSFDAAASSLRRVAFEGRTLEEVLVEDGDYPEDDAGRTRARNRRYTAHKRLRLTLCKAAASPEAAALMAPWEGELAARFFAKWLLRCQGRGVNPSKGHEE